MKTLLTIRDKDIFPDYKTGPKINYGTREASRGVVLDEAGKLAILFVARDGFYKLPGGGLEHGENPLTAMVRECLEETGCYIQNIRELGQTMEYRDKQELRQTSHCYLADVKGDKGQTNFDSGEKDEGYILKWLDWDEVMKIFAGQKTKAYNGNFIIRRDLKILQKAKGFYDGKEK